MLKIYLLGSFQLIRDETPIPESAWHTKQARQLLKILLTQRGKIVSRDYLIDALWPEADPGKAATTLRTAVNALRNTLEPDRPPYTPSSFIVAHAPGYKFQLTNQVWVNVIEFETLLDKAEDVGNADMRRDLLTQAISLYQDDYLPNDLYADWSFFERERLRERYLNALSDLARCQANRGEYDRAIASLRRILARDPGREPVYRGLMRYHLQLGNTVAALKTFEQLRTYLTTELGADPSPQSQALHQAILSGQPLWEPAPAISVSPGRQSPLEAVFIGRAKEIDALTGLLTEAQKGRGSIAALSGESGVGKSRLAAVLLDKAVNRQTLVLSARCQVMGKSLPFAPIIEALESYLLRQPNNFLAQLPEADKIQLAQLLPSLAWQVDISLGAAGLPEGNRQLLVSSLLRALLRLSQNGLLLFIDDLQWVDEASLAFLSKLTRYLPAAKILTLIAYRAEELDQNPPLSQFLHDLNRRRILKPLDLNRFSAPEVEHYLQEISPDLGEEKSLLQALTQRLYRLTGGNPLFLTETLRALLGNRPAALTPKNARRLLDDASLEHPSSHLTDIILARLEHLPPAAEHILDIAAVIGRDFSVDLLETVAAADPLPALSILLRGQFLNEVSPGRLDFSHHLTREVIYARLSPLAKQRLHQRVSDALIALYGQQSNAKASEIANHCLQAGALRRQQAVIFSVLAGEYALRAFSYEQAAKHYRQAIEIANALPSGQELETWFRQAYLGLGLAQESRAEWDAARDTYQAWRKGAQQNHLPAAALMAQYRLASMLGLSGQIDEAAAIAARVTQQLPDNTPPVIADAQKRLHLLVSTQVNPPAWTHAGWPGLTLRPAKLDFSWQQITHFLGAEQAAQPFNLYGWSLTLQGQTQAAETVLNYAAQLSEEYNQPGYRATSYHLMAQLCSLRGDYTRMERALTQALELVEKTPRLRWAVIWGRIHQAYVDMRWNRLTRADERLRQLDRELAGRSAFQSHRLSVQVGLGLLAMFRHNLPEAVRYFDLALSGSQNLYVSNFVVVYLSQARIKRKQGNLEAAQQDIIRAMAFAGERGLLADYISAAVEAARYDQATEQAHHIIPLLEQLESQAAHANLLPARLSVRMALMRVYAALNARNEAAWYRRLARTDRDAIAASIPNAEDRAAYLARKDLKGL